LGQKSGELLLGKVGGAIPGRIAAGPKPAVAALAFGAQDLRQQQRLKLLRGIMNLRWRVRHSVADA
jgi:hypothetical protein